MYKPKEFAKLCNVSVNTLQRWDREKKLVAYRSHTNRRFYTDYHLNKIIVGDKEKMKEKLESLIEKRKSLEIQEKILVEEMQKIIGG